MILKNEQDLIRAIANQSGENQKVVGDILKAYKKVISTWLKEQKRKMELGKDTNRLIVSKFFSLYVRMRESFMGRNPVTGEPSERPQEVKVKIKLSPKLLD